MTALPNTSASFVDSISKLVLNTDSRRSSHASRKKEFPLKIKIDLANSPNATSSAHDLKSHLETHSVHLDSLEGLVEFAVSDKDTANAVVAYLLDHGWSTALDYSQFASHPGMVFVKGLQRSPSLADDLQRYFLDHSKYGLLADVNVLGLSPEDSASDVAAILKFDNYMDADHALAQPSAHPNSFGPRPFNVTRYISKKERSILLTDSGSNSAYVVANDDPVVYDTIVVENFNDFISGTLSLEVFHSILDKFALFLSIDTIFFPVANRETDRLRFKKIGFIGISPNKDLSLKLLKALYYLNGLTLSDLLAFSKDDIYDLSDDVCCAEPELSSEFPRLKLSIAQRKHNHHLYENTDSLYVSLDLGKVQICEPDVNFHESSLINRFVKSSNYQETNVYVNNFPILFENDDELWAQFWNQFGVDRVKSAKIIKPQFYSKKPDGSLGKIGFVFYEEFKMALRAIILTNNKVIKYQNFPSILIQASFAIQKHNSHSQSSNKLTQPKFHHGNPPINYFSDGQLPKQYGGGASPFVPLPEQYLFHPYMMSMPPYGPGMAPDERPDEEGSGDDAAMLMGGNSYPPQYGYYVPYFPYSGQVPMGGPPHIPVNSQPVNSPYTPHYKHEHKSERKRSHS